MEYREKDDGHPVEEAAGDNLGLHPGEDGHGDHVAGADGQHMRPDKGDHLQGEYSIWFNMNVSKYFPGEYSIWFKIFSR